MDGACSIVVFIISCGLLTVQSETSQLQIDWLKAPKPPDKNRKRNYLQIHCSVNASKACQSTWQLREYLELRKNGSLEKCTSILVTAAYKVQPYCNDGSYVHVQLGLVSWSWEKKSKSGLKSRLFMNIFGT